MPLPALRCGASAGTGPLRICSPQAEVADKVAGSLGGNAGSNLGEIQSRLLSEPKLRAPADLSAYDLWLLALEQRKLYTKAGNMRDFEYVDKALAVDPKLASAYATRAWLKIADGGFLHLPWATTGKEVESDLRQALALDPFNADAHAGRIAYLSTEGRWAETSAEIDRAMRDNPANTLVLSVSAAQLPHLGRPEESVAMADLVLRLDPQLTPGRRGQLLRSYFFGRKFERVLEVRIKLQSKAGTTSTDLLRPQVLLSSAAPTPRSAPRPTSSPRTANR
jgi:hypothetical protein